MENACGKLFTTNITQDKIVIGDGNLPIIKIKESLKAQEAKARRQVIARRKAADQDVRDWRLHLETLKPRLISKPCQFKQTYTYLNKTIKESSESRQKQRNARQQVISKSKAKSQEDRAWRLNLKTPKMPKPHQLVQTDKHLIELYEHPQPQAFGTQTEDIFTSSEKPAYADASLQVDETEFFDFDMEVMPIVETMVADVLGQAINEIKYQDEQAAKARHQRTILFEYITADNENLRWEREDEIIRKTIANHIKLFDEGGKNEKARISKLPSYYGVDFLPRLHLEPNQNESTADTIAQAESLEFISWMMKDLQVEKTKTITIEHLLENIQQDGKRT